MKVISVEDLVKAKPGADTTDNPTQDKGNDLSDFIRSHFIVAGIKPLDDKAK